MELLQIINIQKAIIIVQQKFHNMKIEAAAIKKMIVFWFTEGKNSEVGGARPGSDTARNMSPNNYDERLAAIKIIFRICNHINY